MPDDDSKFDLTTCGKRLQREFGVETQDLPVEMKRLLERLQEKDKPNTSTSP